MGVVRRGSRAEVTCWGGLEAVDLEGLEGLGLVIGGATGGATWVRQTAESGAGRGAGTDAGDAVGVYANRLSIAAAEQRSF